MTNRTTDKTIVISVLGFINEHSGYVPITIHLQTNYKLDAFGLNRILTTLTRNGLVTKDMNNKWSVAITDPKGISVLDNPALLDDNGNFISNKSLIHTFKERNPYTFAIIIFILGGIASQFIEYGFNKVFGNEKEKNDHKQELLIKPNSKTEVIDTNYATKY